MKLSEYARQKGVSYKTAWRYWKAGLLKGEQLPTGTIIIQPRVERPNKVIIYTRVSSSENKDNLERQAERLKAYCAAKGYIIADVVKEIGSGVNDNRKLLNKLLTRKDYSRIVVEHKDRLTRFGFKYLETLLGEQGVTIEVVNESQDSKEDLLQDLVAIIYSFCARLYGLRKAKRKTEKIIKELKDDKEV